MLGLNPEEPNPMHLLSRENRSEFLATPQLIRFDYPTGEGGNEPTLLVKANSLLLKYIISGVRLRLIFTRLGARFIYGLQVFDDPDNNSMLWSALERQEEIDAISALCRGEPCQLFLFNELTVCCAWKEVGFPLSLDKMNGIDMTPVTYPEINEQVSSLWESIRLQKTNNYVAVEIGNASDWKVVPAGYVTTRLGPSTIQLLDEDEGRQQENLAVWLTDGLHPMGAHHGLQIPSGSPGGKQRRELADVTLSHEYGTILIESKVLSIFSRKTLPNRAKLASDVSDHITKAVAQLKGGIRKIQAGVQITEKSGAPVEVERNQPFHAIILIPDLDLIQDRNKYGLQFIHEFARGTNGFLHLLDVSELARMVQSAQMIAARGSNTTPMMAFDYYLMKRAEKSIEVRSLCFGMLLRFQ
jgi:hypothetical protein